MNLEWIVDYEEFKKPTQFGFDWNEWLKEDAIVSSNWTIPDTLEKEREAITYSTTTIYLSGGELDTEYQAKNQVVTRDGIVAEASGTIRVMKDPIILIKKEK